MKSSIAESLRKCRVEAGMSVKEISDILIEKGHKASEKTIYSWENGNSQPSPDALLIMCKAYGVRDVLGTFGYTPEQSITVAAHFNTDDLTEEELDDVASYIEFIKNKRKK